jgi:hypothetical protein
MPLYRSLPDRDLETLCRSLSDAEVALSDEEVASALRSCKIDDPFAGGTRRYRLFEALQAVQRADLCANRVYAFLEATLAPDGPVKEAERREFLRAAVNQVLGSAGFTITAAGDLRSATSRDRGSPEEGTP